MNKFVLGIDLGTSQLKSILIDRQGEIHGLAHCGYETKYPHKGWAEQNPLDWWEAAVETISKLLRQNNLNGNEIQCISISSQTPVLLPVTDKGEILFPAANWMDTRAQQQSKMLSKEDIKSKIVEINGNSIDPYYLLPKILWLKQEYPDIYNKTNKFLQANGYIVYRLTGEFSMDITHGPLTLLFNSKELNWSSELCQMMDVARDKLPEVFTSTEVVGKVTKEAGKKTGLKPGIPVLAGCLDTAAAIVANGVLDYGQGYFSIGTGSNVGVCIEEQKNVKGFLSFPHSLPDRWMINAIMTSTGGAFNWCKEQIAEGTEYAGKILDANSYDLMSSMAAKVEPGSDGIIFLPYLNGEQSPIWDPDARGTFFGLNYDTKKAHLIRSIMEGCAYALRQNLDIIKKYSKEVSELILSGGPTRSKVWNQIWADVIKSRVIVPQITDSAPTGSAILAGLNCGFWSDARTAVEAIIKDKEIFEVDLDNHNKYQDYFEIYKELYPELKEQFAKLSQIKGKEK